MRDFLKVDDATVTQILANTNNKIILKQGGNHAIRALADYKLLDEGSQPVNSIPGCSLNRCCGNCDLFDFVFDRCPLLGQVQAKGCCAFWEQVGG